MIDKNKNICKVVKNLDGKILEGWAQLVTENGVPYYINHNHVLTQWDHPEYIYIINEIINMNSIKYAAYRTAFKLRHLQKRLKFSNVSLYCVTSAFDLAGLRAAENRDIISIKEIENILLHILKNAHKNSLVDINVITEVILNFILNAYDENRTGNIQVLQCKIFLLVLCDGRLQEKYRYIFNQIADHNNCCTKKRLARFLHMLSMILELLSEQLNFGVSYIAAAVESCFKEVTGEVGITEDRFLDWLLQEPQILVWWTTFYRLHTAEMVCHDIKCGVCKQQPCVGLRYQCLRCINFNLCQDCFLLGKTSRNHKLSHPIQEYCCESSAKDWRKSFLKKLQYRLRRKSQDRKPRYLTLPSRPLELSLGNLLQETNEVSRGGQDVPDKALLLEPELKERKDLLMSRTIYCSTDELDTKVDGDIVAGEPIILPTRSSHLIQSLLRHIREGHKNVRECLVKGPNDKEICPSELNQYITEIELQMDKLENILKENSSILKGKKLLKNDLPRMESTPIVGERGLHISLSPIGSGGHNDTAVLDNKENHKAEINNGISTGNEDATSYVGQEEKEILPTINENQDISVRPKEIRRFPSFSEVSLSDLTSTSSLASSLGGGAISNNNLFKECEYEIRRLKFVENDEADICEIKEKFDDLITPLHDMFPIFRTDNRSPRKPCDVIIGANEIADVVSNYIECIPFREHITSF